MSDVVRHRSDILLQNEADWFTKPFVLFHHKRTGCADRGMPREVELRPRCEDANPTRVRRIVLWQDETRFSEIEFASNLLHALDRNAGRVRQNRELIAAERCRTENIDDVKWVLHEINLEETTNFDRLGKRADRRREFGRGNCGLAHGKLMWTV